jgi:hypothetical protein
VTTVHVLSIPLLVLPANMSTTTTSTTTQAPHITPAKPAANNVLNWVVKDDAAPSSLHQVPRFTDKHAERQWAKQHMAAAFRTFARLGWADGCSGHISLRDPVNPAHFWISEFLRVTRTSSLSLTMNRSLCQTLRPDACQRLGSHRPRGQAS